MIPELLAVFSVLIFVATIVAGMVIDAASG
jgi:hypothetical protein